MRLPAHCLTAAGVALVVAVPTAAAAPAPTPAPSTSVSPTTSASATPAPIGGERLTGTERTADLLLGADRLPRIKARTWILADATTGDVLAAKGPHVRRAPASTLKMLTALAVLPRTSPNQQYVAEAGAAQTFGARVGLRPGKRYSLDELWYAVFLPSANDAAIAVARANGGVHKTVRQMNREAARLRALDTVAVNTSGLDAPGQLTSAYDLALIARAGLQREDFAHYASTTSARFPKAKGRGSREIYTTNRLLLHGYRGAIGVKTGFTSFAGRTFVAAATRKGTTLIVAMMGIREASEDAAARLLTWGFANDDKVRPVGELVEPTTPAPIAPVSSPEPRTTTPAAAGTTASAAVDAPQPMPDAVLWAVAATTACAAAIVAIAATARRVRARRR